MDRLVTVFGAGGFLGRYVVQHLCKTGIRLRVAQLDPRRAYHLKPLCRVGQIQYGAVDIRKPEQVAAAVRGSDAVVNLVGILKGDFAGVHVRGPRNIAEACAAAKVGSLVHVSAIGADPASESRYGRTKGEGEAALREAFPGAAILRPSILFGQDDIFINRFAGLARLSPIMPVFRADTRFQPVWVADVGRAIAEAALDPKRFGRATYELGGPQVLTMRELLQWICEETGRNRPLAEVPDLLGAAIARLTGWLPGAPLTWDQWLMLQTDSVVSDRAKGLKAFGIAPTPLETVADGWLTSYRKHGRFALKSPF